MKGITSILFKYFFYRELVGRYISIEKPKLGRFSKQQLKVIYKKIKEEQKKLQVKSELSQYKSYGNRLMVYCAVISLAAYRVLREEGLSHRHSTQLIADTIWKLYIIGVKPIWLIIGFLIREPQKRLNYTLRILCIFPFNTDPKGYQFKLQSKSDHLSMDFTQCAAHQFMKTTDNDEEMDFFRNSWCLFDFALPAYLIDGGGYEREHTLSQGDNLCDMKWYAKHIKPEDINLTKGQVDAKNSAT